MLKFSSSNIINHRFHSDNDKGESVIGYDMVIGRGLMVQISLAADFNRQVLKWDGATVHMKDPRNVLGQSNLTGREMCEVAMKTAETASNQEATN